MSFGSRTLPRSSLRGKFAATIVAAAIDFENLTWKTWTPSRALPPSAGLTERIVGGTVSLTSWRRRGALRVALPPVSVARTWTTAVVWVSDRFGAKPERSQGKVTAELTTW